MKHSDRSAAEAYRRREALIRQWTEAGVTFEDPATVYLSEETRFAPGVVVGPNNTFRGTNVIAENCVLEANNVITDCRFGPGVHVIASVLQGACVGEGTTVGPFAYLRPGAEIGAHCRVGDFVEIKNAVLGDGTKVSHLTYVGDAELGKDCNVGCGVVFANYDGEKKQRSEVGSGVFLGSNCTVVAPVRVGDNSYVAAGTTVTKDVEAGTFVIGRVRQQTLDIESKYHPKRGK